MLIDTHVHLNDDRYSGDLDEIVTNFKADNLEKVITIGYDLNSSKKGFEIASKYDEVYVAFGVHPHDALNYSEDFENFVTKNASNKKVVAIGEIGLDYYRNDVPKEVQKEVFVKQLKLANKVGLPVIIHIRDAYEDALKVLKDNKNLLNNSGVLHCYSGSLEYAQEVLKLGLYFGFDGPITFTNSNIAEKVLKHLPHDRVLIETDCPYLTPHPFRGQRNEPKYVGLVAKKLAETFEMSENEAINLTTKNAKALFTKLNNE
ncbi:MAG: TatD family hydrolase [Spirochaetales bacterium]